MVECDNKEGVTALREISADRVRYKEDVAGTMVDFIEEQRRQLRVTTGEHTFLEAASLRALEDDDLDDDDDGDDGDDIEELQADPEALNKQAKKSAEGEEDADSDGESEEPEDSEFTADEDAEFDGDDVPEGEDGAEDDSA